VGKVAKYEIRVDDTTTNVITRTLRDEPHVVDTVTDTEYALSINDGLITVMEQATPTTQKTSDVGLAIGGRDVLRYTFMLQ